MNESDFAGLQALTGDPMDRRKNSGHITLTQEDLKKLIEDIGASAAKAYLDKVDSPPFSSSERVVIRQHSAWVSQQIEIGNNKLEIQRRRIELMKKSLPAVLGGLAVAGLSFVWERMAMWWLTHFRWM